ncbi:hypothetical protein QFC20_006380 [Naganishia adeliensis]|uniref:Uncharacterized protein n=1 Tax=Naganishia adeliensis TaxID=92952 RepID=A0ACC2VC15_9TREE|nr:hypothetical protein QFC20_006380 [Naganishia adeliensis]
MSLMRTIRNIREGGIKEWFRQMTYIGDAKYGKCVGKDQFGNRYFEQLDWEKEIPGRHRWVDYSQTLPVPESNASETSHFETEYQHLSSLQDDFNASQVPPGWHSWLHHIRKLPPTEDPIIKACTPPWIQPFHENLTGTRGQNQTYSTTAPKIRAWEPVVKARGAGAEGSKAEATQ